MRRRALSSARVSRNEVQCNEEALWISYKKNPECWGTQIQRFRILWTSTLTLWSTQNLLRSRLVHSIWDSNQAEASHSSEHAEVSAGPQYLGF